MTELSSTANVAMTLPDRRRSLRAAIVGNALEWFDWTLYTTFSAYIAMNYFDPADGTSALLSTFAIFAVGFVMRPLGGLLFGWIGDRKGRKVSLIATMLLLATTSVAIGLTPDYETIGVGAPALLLLWRLLQGLAYGGETGVAYTYVAELAPSHKRGLWSSTLFVSVMLGVMAATGLAAILTSVLSTEAMESWGWRAGFLIGGFLGVWALIMRRRAGETDVFEKERSGAPQDERPLTRRQILQISARVLMICAFVQVGFYIWVSLPPATAIATKGMDPQGAYIASLLAQLVALFWLPVCGVFADRFGRRRMLAIYAFGVVLAVFPVNLILGSQAWTLFVSQVIGLLIWSLLAGMFPAILAEQVPTVARARTVGMVSSISAALFAGTAPYLNAWLGSIGLGWLFNVYLMCLGALALIAVFIIKETKGVPLDDIAEETWGKKSQDSGSSAFVGGGLHNR